MLKRIERETNSEGAQTSIAKASFPAPFQEGLEYSSPARGTWNIVHTGMLIPQAHEIFVCAQGCLRGVVLTAAEMNALDRYSAIEIREENVLNGNMEELMIEGVCDVLKKLNYKPRAVLIYISCQHFFLAYDQQLVFQTLRERFPKIQFTDCYMIPTLRKSGLTPDQKMRVQLYSLLSKQVQNPKKINLIGSNLPISKTSEMVDFIRKSGFELQTLNWCKDYDEYLDMASASLNLIYEPIAVMAGKELKKRLGQEYLYLPFCFQSERIEENHRKLANALDLVASDFSQLRKKAEDALQEAKELIGDTPIAVDYTFTFRILSFTRMLLEHGFHVIELYADVFQKEEQEDFEWIQKHDPELLISATSRPKMRFLEKNREEKILAVGQKAAYFTGTDYFVNVVESGGLYGYDGLIRIAELMKDAFLHEKDHKTIIQRKGYGCESCI